MQFTHDKLEAYKVAKEFFAMAKELAATMAAAEDAADQLERAALSTMLRTAEGAGRRTGRDKARFFDMARGSAHECAAILDAMSIDGLLAPARADAGRALLHRAVRLLSGLSRASLKRDETA